MVEVAILSESRYPVDKARVKKAVSEAIEAGGIKEAIVSVSVVGSRKMRELSSKYLKDELSHEVLTFVFEDPAKGAPFVNPPEGPVILGDVVVCFPEAVRMAEEENKMVDQEIDSLVVHGCGHLLGKHHEDQKSEIRH